MKNNLNLQLQPIHYFRDGCATHFLNLCHQKEDFLIDCIWNFFATSHCKSPCDGIVKQITAGAALQRAVKDQIFTTKEMFAFCSNKIQGIKTVFIISNEIEMACNCLKERYSAAKTIPSSRGFHQFIPVSLVTVRTTRVSEDEEFCLEFNLQTNYKCALIICKFPSLYCASTITYIALGWFVGPMLKTGVLECSSCIHLIRVDHPGDLFERIFAGFQIQMLLMKLMLHLFLL